MRYSSGGPDNHRAVELFADLVGKFYKFLGFSRIRWFKHGNLGGKGIVSGVLFVLE